MTARQFYKKLKPFFNNGQIATLEREALIAAQDAHGTDHDTATLHDMGRDFIAILIADYIETDPAFIEKLSGDVIPWERRKALIMQFDIEW